jgi:hypothetical protein
MIAETPTSTPDPYPITPAPAVPLREKLAASNLSLRLFPCPIAPMPDRLPCVRVAASKRAHHLKSPGEMAAFPNAIERVYARG